ncbi:hypothetical protein FA15DRAFT_51170 [Coprinopsis marcescibilis]|uniref:Uncharacterized protein n=1 Tax=Coprinopsis marcescibilis TaxID=230819 RepID=A0A5C3KNK7_COPMA|nr:hypothetical protein FA15DRAFT_51170 [Coprinopsis marcescibilis]
MNPPNDPSTSGSIRLSAELSNLIVLRFLEDGWQSDLRAPSSSRLRSIIPCETLTRLATLFCVLSSSFLPLPCCIFPLAFLKSLEWCLWSWASVRLVLQQL